MANLNGIFDLSQTAGSNDNLAGTSILGSGFVATADDSFRNLASFLAKWRDDLGGTAVTSGNDTITVTLNQTITAYAHGQMFSVTLGGTNTGAATLNVNSLGAKNIKVFDGSGAVVNPIAGALPSGNIAMFVYDGTNMMLLNPVQFIYGAITTIRSTDASATAGPQIDFDRNSASPASSDFIGRLRFLGRSSSGTTRSYGEIGAEILDTTNGAEFGTVILRAIVNGTLGDLLYLGLPAAGGGTLGRIVGIPGGQLSLPTGGLIEFFASDYTLTHSSGILTANKDFRITTAGTNTASAVTVGGAQTLTNKTLTSPTLTGATLNGATGTPITAIRDQVFAASGTYTPNANMVYCQIECLGAGGGGGGAITTTAGTINGAGGGGSGGYSRLLASKATIGASQAVTVGAGGAGGVAGNNAGTNGGATSVGTLCIGNGGVGGGGAAAAGAGTAGAAATAGTGDIALPGAIGTIGGFATILTVNASIFGGPGGIGAFGGSPRGRAPGSAGTAGAVKGCGGGGASDSNAGADRAGGAGSDGYVIITEYCSA